MVWGLSELEKKKRSGPLYPFFLGHSCSYLKFKNEIIVIFPHFFHLIFFITNVKQISKSSLRQRAMLLFSRDNLGTSARTELRCSQRVSILVGFVCSRSTEHKLFLGRAGKWARRWKKRNEFRLGLWILSAVEHRENSLHGGAKKTQDSLAELTHAMMALHYCYRFRACPSRSLIFMNETVMWTWPFLQRTEVKSSVVVSSFLTVGSVELFTFG